MRFPMRTSRYSYIVTYQVDACRYIGYVIGCGTLAEEVPYLMLFLGKVVYGMFVQEVVLRRHPTLP